MPDSSTKARAGSVSERAAKPGTIGRATGGGDALLYYQIVRSDSRIQAGSIFDPA